MILVLRLLQHHPCHSSPAPRCRPQRRYNRINIDEKQRTGDTSGQTGATEAPQSAERRPHHDHHRDLFLHLLPTLQDIPGDDQDGCNSHQRERPVHVHRRLVSQPLPEPVYLLFTV